MNSLTWIIRSLVFHRRTHLALAGGAALAAAVLAGAMLAGDALNRNLRRMALERVGGVRSAVELRGRFVDASLADRLEKQTGSTVAPVLRLSSTFLAIGDTGVETRFDRLNAYGVDERFVSLSGVAKPETPQTGGRRIHPGDILLSARVADALGSSVAAPATSLRFEQPSAFPLEMPLGDRRGDRAVRRPVQTRGVLPDAELGRFSLVANQIPPPNAFVDRDWLADAAGVPHRANLLLGKAEPAALEAALRAALLPSDAGLELSRIMPPTGTGGVWLVRSERIYLDEAYARALSVAAPSTPVVSLHHLADAFAAGGRETPYGFITALSPTSDSRLGVVPAGMADDGIVINSWLAETLGLKVGDALTLRWRRFEAGGRLVPDSAELTVARVIDMAAAVSEAALMPKFPGLTDADKCADWDVGLPMERAKLDDPANAAYWKTYGSAPKAYVTLAAGKRMLGTHFGSAMAVRFSPETGQDAIQSALRRAEPRDLGFVVRPVRQEALQAAEQAMDFRELFVGMAFVLMISALILTGLLASLGVANRREEVGVLRASGFGARRIAWLWLAESLPPLAMGAAGGVVAGVGGAWLLVWALNRFWNAAVASSPIPFTVGVKACAVAGALSLGLSLLTVRWGVRSTVRVQVRDLLGGEAEEDVPDVGRRWEIGNLAIALGAALLAAALLVLSGRVSSSEASGIFFGAGLLLMVSLLCLARLAVNGFSRSGGGRLAAGPIRAGLLNVARHRRRSLLVMILLSTGCFLTVGILAMKQDPAADTAPSWSGGGGYGFLVEAAIPLPGDKGGEVIRKSLEAGADALAFRVREGDEAGCLNLNRATQPRVLGVSPESAKAARAFEKPATGAGEDSVWFLLKRTLDDGAIPALAGDLTTVEYGLQAKTGEKDGSVYEFAGENGRVWRLRLVGALPVRTGVLQGSLIIDEAVLTRMAPSSPGAGLWLVRSSLPESAAAARLRAGLGRYGGTVAPVRDRLRLLGAVESTYLDMFLVLGGLGVVLGAVGVGLVVLRNAAARRGELAVLRAVGVPSRKVLAYLAAEYVYVVLAGLVAGAVPALLAVRPAMNNLGQQMPVGAMAWLIAAMFASGLLGTFAAVIAASRMHLMEALRGE